MSSFFDKIKDPAEVAGDKIVEELERAYSGASSAEKAAVADNINLEDVELDANTILGFYDNSKSIEAYTSDAPDIATSKPIDDSWKDTNSWTIERNDEIEDLATKKNWSMGDHFRAQKYDYKSYVSTGMSFEQFKQEWIASGVGRSPTQEEYQNGILWSNTGDIVSKYKHDSERQIHSEDLQKALGLDKPVSFFSYEDLQYLNDNELTFDLSNDNEYVIVPTGTNMANHRYRYGGVINVPHFKDDVPKESLAGLSEEEVNAALLDTRSYDIFFKEEKSEWYEKEWLGYAAGALGLVLTPFTAGLSNTWWGGALAGATQGALTTGLVVETKGGDFDEGLGPGAISGAFSGAASGYAASVNAGVFKTAFLEGLGASVGQYAIGADIKDALQSGIKTGTVGSIKNPFMSAGTSALFDMASGVDDKQMIINASGQFISKHFDKKEDVGTKVGKAVKGKSNG